jgi:hypothetical protein
MTAGLLKTCFPQALSCEDNDVALREMLDDWDQVRQTWPLDWRDSSNIWISPMRKYGCAYLGNKTIMQQAQVHIRNKPWWLCNFVIID